jgi:hypothetical protein
MMAAAKKKAKAETRKIWSVAIARLSCSTSRSIVHHVHRCPPHQCRQRGDLTEREL